MVYAPVIIPTLCRYEHFVRCIESLKKNAWAKYTDMYIGLDYPAEESHRVGYNQIREYLNQEFTEFKSFTVFERSKNYGAFQNIQMLIDYCEKKYDRYITLEDDTECSLNFLEYMDLMLEKYENDDSVIAISGYSAPIEFRFADGCNAVKQQLQANTWGTGRWKSKTKRIKKYLAKAGLEKKYIVTYQSGRLFKMTDWAITDYTNLVTHGVTWNSILKKITDVSLRIFLTVEDKYVIMPVVSKTRNLGFDGSGLYCQEISYSPDKRITSENYDYSNQKIDKSINFVPMVDEEFDNEYNRSIYNQFDMVSKSEMDMIIKDAENYCKLSRLDRFLLNKRLIVKSILKRIKKV